MAIDSLRRGIVSGGGADVASIERSPPMSIQLLTKRHINRLAMGLLLGSLVSFGAFFVAPAFAQGVYMEHEGLAVSKDRFDEIVSRAFACPNQHYKKRLEDLNRREGLKMKPPECGVGRDILKLLVRVQEDTGGVEPYLVSRGGNCSKHGSITRCVVVRHVTQRLHLGDRTQATKFRTIFTIEIILDGSKPKKVAVEREDLSPAEHQL